MKSYKKQIKKELKMTLKLISKLKKNQIKNHQDSMMSLFNEVNGVKNIVKFMIEQKNKKEVQKDLETV
jgi:hypothetical protein